MRTSLALILVLCFAPPLSPPEKGGDDETGQYDVIANWPQPFDRPGYVNGAPSPIVPGQASAASASAIFAESPDRIFWAIASVTIPRRDAQTAELHRSGRC